MTVCIAAISDEGRGAVLAADKMLTSIGGLLPYRNDGTGDKIFQLSDHVRGMWAGGLGDATNILQVFRDDNPNPDALTVEQTAERLRLAYLKYLLSVLERENITGRGIASIAEFYGNQAINLTADVRQQIQIALATYNLNSNTQFIVCGKDADNLYKIFVLNGNPRTMNTRVTEGYAQIGSGWGHAQFSMIHSRYKPALLQADVEKIIKTAKRRAEKDPGVGKLTDVVLLS
jgi:20S proteasome alpha/beta subunit